MCAIKRSKTLTPTLSDSTRLAAGRSTGRGGKGRVIRHGHFGLEPVAGAGTISRAMVLSRVHAL